jgi:hypothetical protein
MHRFARHFQILRQLSAVLGTQKLSRTCPKRFLPKIAYSVTPLFFHDRREIECYTKGSTRRVIF